MYNFLELIRIKHWVKNFLIFIPFIASFKYDDLNTLLNVTSVFIIFCLISSFVYITNDIIDKNDDAKHFYKKNRPITKEIISIKNGILIAISFLFAAFVFIFILNNHLIAIICSTYVILNIIYSFFLKKLFIIDTLTISMFFLIRIYAGTVPLPDKTTSVYIFCAIFFLSLFFGFIKRKFELLSNGDKARRVLRQYSIKNLNYLISICAVLALFYYYKYSQTGEISLLFEQNTVLYSLIFISVILFRCLAISNNIITNDSLDEILKDKVVSVSILGYLIYIIILISNLTR